MSTLSHSTASSAGYETPPEDLPGEVDVAPALSNGKSVRFSTLEEMMLPDDGQHHSEGELVNALRASEVAEMLSMRQEEIIERSYFHRFPRPQLGTGFLARIFRKWPRTYALCVGIIIPLWVLVLLSLLAGKFLGELEYSGEIEANDDALRSRALLNSYTRTVRSMLEAIPTVCYLLFKNNNLLEMEEAFQKVLETEESLLAYADKHKDIMRGDESLNVTSFLEFMDACGQLASNYTERIEIDYFDGITADHHDTDRSMTFHWIRCVNRSSPTQFNRIFVPTTRDVNEAHPSQQEAFYEEMWTKHQVELYDSYREQFIAENETVLMAGLKAFNLSIEEATAKETCAVNVPAAGKLLHVTNFIAMVSFHWINAKKQIG